MDLIPKIKNTVLSFLTSEEGKISKQSIVLLGTLVSAAAIASISSKPVHAQCYEGGGGGGGCGQTGSSTSGSVGGCGCGGPGAGGEGSSSSGGPGGCSGGCSW